MQITHHQPFVSKHIDEPTALFQDIIHRLNKAGIPWCVGGGTLLGLIRDKKLIPTDTDLDFMILGNKSEEIRKIFHDFPLGVEVKTMERVQQLAYWPQEVVVDFHFYTPRDGKYSCHHVAGELELPFYEFEKPQALETKYGPVNIPPEPEKYLLGKYGEDWKTPQYQKKGTYKSVGMVMGCFDPPHYGHLNMIRRCYEFARELIIIVRTDKHIRRYKNRESFMDEVTRGKLMSLMGKVYISEDKEAAEWVEELKPTFFFCDEENVESYKYLPVEVIGIPRTPNVSSTQLRQGLDTSS